MTPLLSLIQSLIRCPSITPNPDKTFDIIKTFLKPLGFEVETVVCQEVTNLYAHRMRKGPHLCFAGHVDVVPPGDLEAWSVPPFEGRVHEGVLWGRGIADMKGAIGCFLIAVQEFLSDHPDTDLSLSLLLTSDEEGPAMHGIQQMIPWLQERHIKPDLCVIGEPTGLKTVGEILKVGRRGSVTGTLRCLGIQGHIAYPHLADNPIPRLITCLQTLSHYVFDMGTPVFEPTRCEITSIDVGNPTTNIIPRTASARFGIRFNTCHTSDQIADTVRALCAQHAGSHELSLTQHGEAFLTQDSHWIKVFSQAIAHVTHKPPTFDTTGGTTDGRFLSVLCPVLECGLLETTIHQVNENASLDDLEQLKSIYRSLLDTV